MDVDPPDIFCEDQPSRPKFRTSPKFATIAGHHASPIYAEECRELLVKPKKVWKCKRHRKLSTRLKKEEVHGVLTDLAINPRKCIKTWIRSAPIQEKSPMFMIESLESWALQKLWFLSSASRGGTIDPEIIAASTRCVREKISTRLPELSDLYRDLLCAEHIKDKICNKEIHLGEMFSYLGGHFERDISIMRCDCHGVTVVPTPMVIDTLDQMQTRFPLYLYWLISDILGKKTISLFEIGHKLVMYFDNLLDIMGDDALLVLSTWEPLMIGWVILYEDDVGFRDLYETQMEEMREISGRHGVELNFDLLLPQGEDEELTCIYLEMLGIMKHFGYPVLDIRKLLDPLKQYGTGVSTPVVLDIVTQVLGVVKRDFCVNFRKKHGKYPILVDIPQDLGEVLLGNLPIPEDLHKKYYSWEKVEFGKNLEYDYTPDKVELLKDSACANPLSSWGKQYDKCGFSLLYNKPPPRSSEGESVQTRVILAYLQSDPEDLKRTIEERELGILHEDDHLAFMSGKECELKPGSGRAFAIQTFLQRMLQSSNEFNTGHKIFKYVPEQSMTDSEVVEAKRLLEQVKGLLNENELFVLDLKKWCIYWRWEAIIGLSRMYDQLFGFRRVYTNAHTYYIGCKIFANLRLFPPDYDYNHNPIPGDFFFDDFVGGMQGIHQKRWTHMTVAALTLAAEMSDVDVQIIGQGDNQIVALKYRKDQNKDLVRALFRTNLTLVLNGIGHDLKERETWISRHLHEYGKLRMYHGGYVSQGTKRACKVMPDSNDLLNSTPSMISTLNTMTEGMARLDYSPDVAFIINCMMVFHFLHRIGILKPRDHRLYKQAMMLFPVDFGGLTLSNYNNHLVRGHSDQVTVWLDLLLVIKHVNAELFKFVTKSWQLINPEPLTEEKFQRLIEDIYSLRIATLPSIEQSIRDDGLAFLKSDFVTNPAVTMLYDETNMFDEMNLVNILRTMNPFFAQIAHVLFVNSNVGLLKRLPSRFTSVKTIGSVVLQNRAETLISRISYKNEQYKNMARARLRNGVECQARNVLLTRECSTEIADYAREEGWEKRFVSLTKPVPQHQFTIIPLDMATDDDSKMCVTIKTSQVAQRDPTDCSRVYGPFRPYIGSVTDQKAKRPTIEFAERTGHVKALLKLGETRTWARLIGSENLVQLATGLIEEKLQHIHIPPEVEDIDVLFKQITSGNIGHRFLIDMEKPYAMVNSLPAFTTHFFQSSNKMASLSEGGRDHNIFYQELYVTNMQSLHISGTCLGYLDSTYIAVPSCHSCLKDITDLKFDLDQPGLLVRTPYPVTTNPEIGMERIPNDILDQMEFTLGIELGKNIDVNFRIHHCNESSGKHNEPHKEQISLNDVRQVNIVNLMTIACLYSNHFRKLLTAHNDYALSQSVDLAFIFLAEVIINSGLLSEFISLTEMIVHEHSGLTRFERLSTHFARGMIAYIRKHPNESLRLVLRYNFQDAELDQSWFFKLIVSRSGGDKALKLYKKIGMKNEMLKLVGLPPTTWILSKLDVITQWRASVKLPQQKFVREIVEVPKPSKRYPLLEVQTYHSIRVLETGFYQIKDLRFLCRPLGVISSAANKYIELTMVLGIEKLKADVDSILSLAEGSGGTLATLSEILNARNCCYNSLNSEEIDPRDDITDTRPVAFIATGDTDKLLTDVLARGTTDITHPMFKLKLDLYLQKQRVDLVTVDAESMVHGTNFNYLEDLMPIFTKHKIKYIIIKMFMECDLTSLIENNLDIGGYSWFLFKPISSNPVGTEVLFCAIRADRMILESTKLWLRKSWGICSRYISHKRGMTSRQIDLYISLSKVLSKLLISICPSEKYHCKNKHSWYILGSRNCSVLCKRQIDKIITAIDNLHSGQGDDLFRISARAGGIGPSLSRMLCDLVFLVCINSSRHSLLNCLLLLDSCVVQDILEFRHGQSPFIRMTITEEGNFYTTWGDGRTYFRQIGLGDSCQCEEDPQEWSRRDRKKSLSRRLFKNMYIVGLCERNELFKYRTIPRKLPSERLM